MENVKADKLKKLYEVIQEDGRYRTAEMGKSFVPGVGPIEGSPIVLVGEAPGKEEEKQREPFVGPAGKNLNYLLDKIDLSRGQVFITNLVKYRPLTRNHGNRSPSAEESRNALPYLLEELQILDPLVAVCLGLSSAKALLEKSDLRMKEANACFFEKHGLKILVTYHPSPFNYMIAAKRAAMEMAFRKLKRYTDSA
ncbi:MAG: uracil-DNA glycosylase [Desulfoferrobacter sp.]